MSANTGSELDFFDLVVLRSIVRLRDTNSTLQEISQHALKWIQSECIGAIYCRPGVTEISVRNSTYSLRKLGLIAGTRGYEPTFKAVALIENLPSNWQRWPIGLPCDDGVPDFEKAHYLPELW